VIADLVTRHLQIHSDNIKELGEQRNPEKTTARPNSDGRCGTASTAVAEEVGFEPTVSCPTHAFQACRFGRSRTPPDCAQHNRQKRLAFQAKSSARVAGRGGWVLRRGILVNRVRAGTQQPSTRRTGAAVSLAAAPSTSGGRTFSADRRTQFECQAAPEARNMATIERSMNEPRVDQSVRPDATHEGITDAYTPSTA
jgi:hypothetical protein